MATSSHPAMAKFDPTSQVIAHSSLKGAQAASMVAPPVYLVSSLILRRGSGFSIRHLMRYSTLGTAAGAGLGAAVGWVRLRTEPLVAIEDRVFRLVRPRISWMAGRIG
jgi:hypothetical protein